MNYTELKEKFEKQFYSMYEDFINEQIIEIQQANYLIDISQYTSSTVTEPKNMIRNFLNEEKVSDQMLGSFDGNFRLSLSLLLELDSYDERRKLDLKLFNEIVKHNIEFKNR